MFEYKPNVFSGSSNPIRVTYLDYLNLLVLLCHAYDICHPLHIHLHIYFIIILSFFLSFIVCLLFAIESNVLWTIILFLLWLLLFLLPHTGYCLLAVEQLTQCTLTCLFVYGNLYFGGQCYLDFKYLRRLCYSLELACKVIAFMCNSINMLAIIIRLVCVSCMCKR